MLPQPDPELAMEHGLFSVGQALAAGHSRADIARNLRRGRWTSVDRGVLVSADRQPTDFDDLLLATLIAGPSAVLFGRSAAQVLGWDLLIGPPVPEVAVPDTPRARTGSPLRPRFVRRTLGDSDVELRGLLRITTPARTAVDLAADLPLVEAVVAVDAGYRSGSLPAAEALAELRSRSHMRGRQQARRVLSLTSSMAGSVRESEIRVRIVCAGLVPPVEQFPVVVDGVLVARVDFAWPRLMLVLEIDGFTYHSDRRGLPAGPRPAARAGGRRLESAAVHRRRRPRATAGHPRQPPPGGSP